MVALVRRNHPSPPRNDAEAQSQRNAANAELDAYFETMMADGTVHARKLMAARYIDPVVTKLEHVAPSRAEHLLVRNAPSVTAKRVLERLGSPGK